MLALLPVASVCGVAPPLKLDGRQFVDSAGKPVVLRGCNLGNWLLLEPWMLAIDDARIRDQHDIHQLLEKRFGRDTAEELLDVYRTNWIAQREFELIKSFGFNLVRLPFHYSLLTDETGPLELHSDAFKWLDRAVKLAADADMYVILDLHGVPGGQSKDMTTGRVGQNRLWTDADCQARTIWLWRQIAKHYRTSPTVVAYDILNEPWGDYVTDVREPLVNICERVIAGVREIDPDTLIFVPGTLRGVDFYGPPADHGWRAVGYTEHYYPGLHGNGAPTLETHRHFIQDVLPAKQDAVQQWHVPFLVGEFNVVHASCLQAELMDTYYRRFADYGWLSTMWSVRKIEPAGGLGDYKWALFTNAEPFTLPNLFEASADEIHLAFTQLGSQPLDVDTKLRALLTDRAAGEPFTWKTAGQKPARTPLPDGWQLTNIGSETSRAFVSAHPDGQRVEIHGIGNDIWDNHDAFTFMHREVTGDASQTVWLTEFDGPRYAKAGVMIRASTEPDAAHGLVHAFSDGRVLMAWRTADGAKTNERLLSTPGLPAGLAIERAGEHLFANVSDIDGNWQRVPFPTDINLPATALVGLATNSRNDAGSARAVFLCPDAPDGPPPTLCSPNLLANGSFEQMLSPDASDQAQGWHRWGHWLNRESDWQPRRDGNCVLGYHHYRISAADSSGWYQDVSLADTAKTCTFSVCAQRDAWQPSKNGPASVELRLETTIDGRQATVASETYTAADLAPNPGWSRLHVSGVSPTAPLRVLIIVNPSDKAPRAAALKFDDAQLFVSPYSKLQLYTLSNQTEEESQ